MLQNEIIELLSKDDLDFEDFRRYMSGKQLCMTSKGMIFPKEDVLTFIDKETYNKENNYD